MRQGVDRCWLQSVHIGLQQAAFVFKKYSILFIRNEIFYFRSRILELKKIFTKNSNSSSWGWIEFIRSQEVRNAFLNKEKLTLLVEV